MVAILCSFITSALKLDQMNSLEHATYLYGNNEIISLDLQSGLFKQIQAFRDLHFF